MRVLAVGCLNPVNRFIIGFLLVNLLIFLPVFVVCRISFMSEFPWYIRRIIHGIVHAVEYGNKTAVIASVHHNDVYEGDAHPVAENIQHPVCPLVFFSLFSLQVIVHMVPVYQCCSGVRHVVSGDGVLIPEDFRKADEADGAVDDAEQGDKQYHCPYNVNRHAVAEFIRFLHSLIS